jgi:catechol 2,3-dioxygenase-like lactoylglutathione lyase family enzyme
MPTKRIGGQNSTGGFMLPPNPSVSMAKTRGLTHLALAVRDPDRSLPFYEALGCTESWRGEGSVEVTGPSGWDVISLERRPRLAGKRGGMEHFGFRLLNASDLDFIVEAAVKAGGKLKRRGQFGPGQPFAYLADPDGYEVELWFEPR